MSHIYLDREGADQQMAQIQTQIEALEGAAASITAAMASLAEVWKGNSADRAQQTYEAEYRTLLSETIPETVSDFRRFLNGCIQAIYETDQQLSLG